ncbi:hypothetical protein [Marivirga harenae]|uniref:hypothetical protein n=1 Tax=Marivirga harenae TaxID=2010992 RepID=UPI0026DF8B73|nr:hypothetical protein [Marivirga harenae]WKV11615.1 hypothetical protein Q3Y49_15535 [Marivirga harenae]
MKTRGLKLLICAMVLSFAISTTQAQQFLTPVSTLTGDAMVETTDGKMIEGDIRTAFFSGKGLKSFRIKDAETGDVTRFKAEEVKSLRIKMDGWGKLATYAEQTSSLQKMATADFDEAVDREYIYYHTVKWPGKKDKFMLSQLLNPGFDNKIKVYDYPGKKTASAGIGGMTVVGGNAKKYVVAIDGKTYMVEKGKYKKEDFDMLFSDCEKLNSLEKSDKEWDEMALHVFVNDTECD